MSRPVSVGSKVRARPEPDEPLEDATVQSIDAASMKVSVVFASGFRAAVALADVEFPQTAEWTANSDAAADAAAADDGYAASVADELPAPPGAEEQKRDPEAKYAHVAAHKEAGNKLFKQGKFEWAIRTYRGAVDSLAAHCYPSRERMLWDYCARVPCAQCYSNAALCALKLEDWSRAAALCALAMECRPEDTDLVKVLLRHGTALVELREPERAKEALERALDKDPANRAVKVELGKAKRALSEVAKEAGKRVFQGVDLHRTGLTSKHEHATQALHEALGRGSELVLDGKDAEALEVLRPLLEGKLRSDARRRAQLAEAAYAAGLAHYHVGARKEAIEPLGVYFETEAALAAEGAELPEPAPGRPLARFYLAHALFDLRRWEASRGVLQAYLADVEAAGPQAILNMPDGFLGKKVSETERKASRFRARSCSGEARADAHTMLAMIAEHLGGNEGMREGLPHLEASIALAETDSQRLGGVQNLARAYTALGEAELAAEQEFARAELEEKIRLAEAKAREKKAAEEAKAAAEPPTDLPGGAPEAEQEAEAPSEEGAGAEAGGEV